MMAVSEEALTYSQEETKTDHESNDRQIDFLITLQNADDDQK